MADPRIAVALFVRDLLTYEEQLIKLGREGYEITDFTIGYIVVDALARQERIASLESYDGTAEELKLGSMWRGQMTLDFYGDGAYDRAVDFSLRMRSQAALELKKTLGIEIQQPTGPTDVKQLTGQQYGERVQLEMAVQSSSEVTINTLRIDTAQFEIRNEEGIQYVGESE